MFCDIKDKLDDPTVRTIMAASAFDPSPKAMEQKAAGFRRHESWQLYGWVENDEIVGVCGFEVHKDYVEILNIAVAENIRHRGVGGKMIAALQKKCEMAIEAETDGDAVDFYRKRGFIATAIQKYGVRRWTCVLATPKPPNQETDEERRARIYPIVLSEYNPAWPEWYAGEKVNLERLIGTESIVRISHIGSTSVPGLMAKPTVDILLEIKENADINKLIAALPLPNYICLSGAGLTVPTPPPHLRFIKGYLPDGFAEKVFHIHLVYPADHDEILFKDYLMDHPKAAAEYAELKRRLFKDYEHDRDGYTKAKTEFIRSTTQKAKDDCQN